MRELVGVDWGTSSLRAARIAADGRVIEERKSARGTLTVQAEGFPAVLADTCADWLEGGTLCLVSGMAGSRQGWQEAPYCPCPAGFGELGRRLAWITPGRIALVPGLSCEDAGAPDVMRGEEVQIFGALSLLQRDEGVFVLPGTHSKWARVEDGRVRQFKTFMTGEVYALLRQYSILARTMAADDGPLDDAAFLLGVHCAQEAGSLLSGAFSARTRALFGQLDTAVLPSYLSGLVIGEELRAQQQLPRSVTLIGSAGLVQRYACALDSLGVEAERLASEATWRGLWALAQTLETA